MIRYILLSILCLGMSAQFAHSQQTQTRSLERFTEIVNKGWGNVRLIQGRSPKIVITGRNYDPALVTTEVKNGILYINSKQPKKWQKGQRVDFTIYTDRLEGYTLQGSGNMEADDLGNQGDFLLKLQGSGNITCKNLTADKVTLYLQGSGNVTLSGSCGRADIHLQGSGNINAETLRAESADVYLQGSGNIYVHATEYLDIQHGGSGNIYYKGRPLKLNKNHKGVGDIEAM